MPNLTPAEARKALVAMRQPTLAKFQQAADALVTLDSGTLSVRVREAALMVAVYPEAGNLGRALGLLLAWANADRRIDASDALREYLLHEAAREGER